MPHRRQGSLYGTIAVAVTVAVFAVPASAEARKVFVSDTDTNAVAVIETATHALVTTITSPPGAFSAPRRLAISPDGKRVYVPNGGGNELAVVNADTNQASGSITVGSPGPNAVAVTPDGTRAYAARGGNDTAAAVDLQTGTAINSAISLPGTGSPFAIAISPDGLRAYVARLGTDDVAVVDTTSNTALPAAIALGAGAWPQALVFKPDGSRLYVSNYGTDKIAVIDPITNTPLPSIDLAVADDPRNLVISPDGTKLYVVNQNGNSVKEIDTATNLVTRTLGLAATAEPHSMAITPDGKQLYFDDDFPPDAIYVVETASLSLTGAPIPLGGDPNPRGIAIVPNQGPTAAFTVNAGSAGESTSFDGSASTDADGFVSRYDWDFGDGTTWQDGGPTPAHVYAAPGTYVVSLTVTDNENGSTTRVFTGQTALQNGSARATTGATVAVAAAEGDRTAPSVTINKLRSRARVRRRAFKTVTGTATDASGVRSVEVSLLRRHARQGRRGARGAAARRCQRLSRKGKLDRKLRRCKPSWVEATGTTRWRIKIRRPLPGGRYVLSARATDNAGNTSEPVTINFRLV